ncbi:Uncharacterised protein [Yersinia intermedia]|nr:Uncharacterised protein [Yersinia intermedia]
MVAGAAFFPAFWMALNQTLYGIRRAYHLSLRRATYVAIMVRISLRIHHIPKLIRFGCSRFASAVGSDCNPLYPFRTDLASCRVDGLIKHHVDLSVNTVFILFLFIVVYF